MKKLFLKLARCIVRRLPRGKTLAINYCLSLFGTDFDDVIMADDGRKFFVKKITPATRELFFLGTFEKKESQLMSKIIKRGDTVFDLGANFGWYALLFSKLVGQKGRVFAFEMSSEISKELEKNVDLNNAHNVFVENLAIGDREKDTLYFYSEQQGTANLLPELIYNGRIDKTVTMTTLDNYLVKHNISEVDFIKCDIDGTEIPFLNGAKNTLKKQPFLIVEVSSRMQRAFGFEPQNILYELEKYNYMFFNIEANLAQIFPTDIKDSEREYFSNILCVPKSKINQLPDLLLKMTRIL